MPTKRFRTLLEKDPNSQTTSIIIPFDVQEAFGSRARLPVRGTINGFAFRSSIFPMGDGKHYMVVNKTMREGAQVKGGDIISVALARDEEPRVIVVPDDLRRAMKRNKAAQSAWERSNYSQQKEYVKGIEEAKKAETRARRIEKAISELADKGLK